MQPGPGRLADRCGTNASYAAGCRCQPCRRAHYLTCKEYKLRKHRRGGQRILLPAEPYVRRMRALQAIGWTPKLLGEMIGLRSRNWINDLENRHATVSPAKAQQIIDLYDRLSGTPGPSDVMRALAITKRWAPPAAWEDIDNDSAPTGVLWK